MHVYVTGRRMKPLNCGSFAHISDEFPTSLASQNVQTSFSIEQCKAKKEQAKPKLGSNFKAKQYSGWQAQRSAVEATAKKQSPIFRTLASIGFNQLEADGPFYEPSASNLCRALDANETSYSDETSSSSLDASSFPVYAQNNIEI
jgi:hypothetical protein